MPIDIADICKHLGIRVVLYSEAKDIIELLSLEKYCTCNHGVTLFSGGLGCPIILVDDSLDKQQQRFTIAHEIGHIFMSHRISAFIKSDSVASCPDIFEHAADIFAISLLCPWVVLRRMNNITYDVVASLCDVPMDCAKYSVDNMNSSDWLGLMFKYENLSRILSAQFAYFVKKISKKKE